MFHIRGFAGEMPRSEPRYLADQFATNTKDTKLSRGHLGPFSEPTSAHVFGSAVASIYLHRGEWLSSPLQGVDWAPGPVAEDRVYITRPGQTPQLWYDGAVMGLAVPAPTSIPTAVVGGAIDAELAEETFFATSFVTTLGEESAMGPVTSLLTASPNQHITLGNLVAPPAGRLISHRRIYRAVTTASGVTEMFFVAEISASAVSFVHNLSTHPIQEAAPNKDYDAPVSGLQGITVMPNGMMAAFRGKELFFCEPSLPHAWPRKYAQVVNDPIVALCAFGSSLAVLTEGTPWVAQGLHPEQIALEKMEHAFPCLSGRGTVDMGYSAIFPSVDGLVEVSPQGARMISGPIWTREQWRNLNPSSFIAGSYNGKYLFSYSPIDAAGRELGILDTTGAEPFLVKSDLRAHEVHTAPGTGRPYLLLSDQVTLLEFDPSSGSSARPYVWRSKPFVSPFPVNLGAIKIETTAGVGSVRVYGDGNLLRDVPASNRIERLPSDQLYTVYEVEAVGTATITRISLGKTPEDVAQ